MTDLAFNVSDLPSKSGELSRLVELKGVLDRNTQPTLQEQMDALLEQGVQFVTLDLAGLTSINSTGLGTLLKYKDAFDDAGGRLALRRIPPAVQSLMEMLGFDTLLPSVRDNETAIIEPEKPAEAPRGCLLLIVAGLGMVAGLL